MKKLTNAQGFLIGSLVVSVVALALGKIGYAVGYATIAIVLYPWMKRRDARRKLDP